MPEREDRAHVLSLEIALSHGLREVKPGGRRVADPQHVPRSIAFAGLLFGNQSMADTFKSDEQLTFPVYGIRDAIDPYAVNELIETVGTSHGTRAAVYGGTLVMVNSDRKVLFKLEKDEVKQLPDKLADLGY